MNTEVFISNKICKICVNTQWVGKPDKVNNQYYYNDNIVNLSDSFQEEDLSPDELLNVLSELGFAICPRLTGEHRNTANFVSNSVALVDIDGGMTIEELELDNFYKKFGFGYYTTPSYTDEHHKFRIIFILENDITTAQDMRGLYLGLRTKYQAADRACSDASRLFFGTPNAERVGRNGQYLPQSEIEKLIAEANPILPLFDNTHYLISDNYIPTTSDEDAVCEILSNIPRKAKYPVRFQVSNQVLRVLGQKGKDILFNHFIHSNPTELRKQIDGWYESSLNGHHSNAMGALVNLNKAVGINKRLPNKIKSRTELIKHDFPKLPSSVDINEVLTNATNDINHDAHLFRISTGSGKSVTITDFLSKQPRTDRYLLVCDTNPNIEEQVDRINLLFKDRTKNKPIETFQDLKTTIPPYANYKFSHAMSIKGRTIMCNRIKSDNIEDEEFKKQNLKNILPSVCDDCFLKLDRTCNYWKQVNKTQEGTLIFSNVYVCHFNSLYNEHNELFKDINNIKGIIIDENAIQQFENGFSQCVIIIDDATNTSTSTVAPPTSFLHKKITPHKLLIDIFKQAYGIDDLNLTTSELKSLRVIHGDELIAAINATKVNFHIKTALKKHTQAQYKIRQNSGTPFVNKIDIYENVLRYLTDKENRHLFGMRIDTGAFIQGGIKRIIDKYADTKIIYMDATMNLDLVADTIFKNKKVEKTAIDIKMSDDIAIYQLNGMSCSKTKLNNNGRFSEIISHVKKQLEKHNLVEKQGALITYKYLAIDGVDDSDFTNTAAKMLWGNDYVERTTNKTRYFGNTRGYDDMKDCDYLVIIGDFNIPEYEIGNTFWNIYNELPNLTSGKTEYLNRMKDGSCTKTYTKSYKDSRIQAIYEHLCISEIEQALGRGRLIHGSAKTIFVYSSMPLGRNVEITEFMDAAEVFSNSILDEQGLIQIKDIGYIHNKRKELMAAFVLSEDQWHRNKSAVHETLISEGFTLQDFQYNKHKKIVTKQFYVFDDNRFAIYRDAFIRN
jgi:hypothetical protein